MTSKILVDKQPQTGFMDEEDNIKVTLISSPDIKDAEKMIVDVCYGYDQPNIYDELTPQQRKEAIETVLSEGTLPKALEMLGKFVFLVENISLTVTHCIVRHRFFTILQSSTAVSDLRNENYVMPRAFNRDREFYERIKKWYLDGKELFCEAVDKHGISVQNARLLIPKNNCNHMFIGCDLKALKEAYGQRTCTQEEPIQNNIIFIKMRDLVLEKFPYLRNYFKSDCETGRCLHCKKGKHANVVFKRDKLHSKLLTKDELEEEETLHPYTRDEMNVGDNINTEFYMGYKKQ